MSAVETLLNRLEAVQKAGPGWRAKCPACGGRSRKLSISEADEGRALVHCFAGCDAAAIVEAAGLTLADLFPERLRDDTPDGRRKARRAAREAQWGAALDVLVLESRIVQIAVAETLAGRELDWTDFQRLVLAQQRIDDAHSVLRDVPTWRPQAVAA